jgi:hypothetical protein
LRAELEFVASHWADIAPGQFGGAPSVGRIEATLRGFERIASSSYPDFEVDSAFFLKLARTSNLYGHPHMTALSELIANAIDATLIRLWSAATPATRATRTFEEWRIAASEFPVRVEATRVGGSPTNEALELWSLRVIDSGIGIGYNDLPFLKTIGSSSRNGTRQSIVRGMPEYLRPTGSFGIGLQSAFLVTDELQMQTVHAPTNQARQITLRQILPAAPLGPTGGRSGIFVRLETEGLRSPGTTISLVTSMVAGFDRHPDDAPWEAQPEDRGWRRPLSQVLGQTFCPVLLNGEVASEPRSEGWGHFDEETATLITFAPGRPGGHYYRGIRVTNPPDEMSIGFSVDHYFGRANEVLRIARDSFTIDAQPDIRERTQRALQRAVPKYLAHLRRSGAHRELVARVSFFARHSLKLPEQEAGDEWPDARVLVRASREGQFLATVAELLNSGRFRLVVGNGEFSAVDGVDTFSIMHGQGPIFALAQERYVGVQLVGPVTLSGGFSWPAPIYEFSREPSEHAISDEAFPAALIPRYSTAAFGIPCRREYKSLSMRRDALSGVPEMLSPFAIKYESGRVEIGMSRLQPYVEYVTANGIGLDSTDEIAKRKEVAAATAHYVRTADEIYRAVRGLTRNYDLSEVDSLLP